MAPDYTETLFADTVLKLANQKQEIEHIEFFFFFYFAPDKGNIFDFNNFMHKSINQSAV